MQQLDVQRRYKTELRSWSDGAGVGEIIAQEMLHGRNPTFVSAEELKLKLIVS